MAKEPEAPEGEAPKKKGKLLIIIIAIAAVVLVGGGVGAYLLLSKPAAEKAADGHGDEAEEVVEDDKHPPIYEKLEQFTTRLSDGESYLQCEINLKVADAKVQEKIKLYMPEIRDALLSLLSSKTAEEITAVEQREALSKEVQQKVNEILGIKKASKGVQKVLFPAFIIQ
jgi:flagellar FliL protein